jgi:putative transposase
MSDYRRAYSPGGTFFFTVVTHDRQPILCGTDARNHLRSVMRECQQTWPFEVQALVLLPEHLHTIWTLPEEDSDFSRRWGWIKKTFTQRWLASGHAAADVSESKARRRRRGVWQVRFWEHQIRDEQDMKAHFDYIHYNPVRHGLATCPHQWPYSTFLKWVAKGEYAADWICACGERKAKPPGFDRLPLEHMELGNGKMVRGANRTITPPATSP